MSSHTVHFVLTPDGGVREFSAEQAGLVATGADRLPEFAQRRLRYLQVTVSDDSAEELKVQTAGALISFDGEGRLSEAGAPGSEGAISRFELDACVQWALKKLPQVNLTFH